MGLSTSRSRRGLLTLGVAALVVLVVGASGCAVVSDSSPSAAAAAGTVTYSATQTIPVPPASTYAGSGGGDGWGIALSNSAVYNVFHHSSSLTVACHLQSDASPCWNPETITDNSGNGFATSGHPGLWLDQASGKLYVYGTRTSDATGGVVCVDTTQAATNPNPFCGFTALTAVGDAPISSGISAISAPALVNGRWYAFNYAQGSGVTGTQNKLLCFDLTTFAACAGQPYTVTFGAGTVQDGDYPPPGVAVIGGHVIVPVNPGIGDQLACFDPASHGNCAGVWPVTLGFSYDAVVGTPFPLLNASGATIGLCLPNGIDPCYDLSGASVATPSGLTDAVTASSGWNGAAVTVGPRVYVPNGNADAVDCYDFNTSSACANFPKVFSNLYLLYTVNTDPQRPTCLWVNADSGGGQLQNFDAYSGGACGQGPIRVLASSFVVDTQLCRPASYTSLQVTDPPRSAYTSGTVQFQDADAVQIPGLPNGTLDNTGTVNLSGLNLSTAFGLPQFLITLNGAQARPGAVTVKLVWTGTNDPSCVKPGTTVGGGVKNYVAMGDSYSSGEGNAPFDSGTDIGGPDSCHRSPEAWPRLDGVSQSWHLACSGAKIVDFYRGQMRATPDNRGQLDRLLSIEQQLSRKGQHVNEVTLTIGGNDVGFGTIVRTCFFAECLAHPEREEHVVDALVPRLDALLRNIHAFAPKARVILVGYPQIFPTQQSGNVRCGWLTPRERERVNTLAAELDVAWHRAAKRAGVQYVSVLSALFGHELCTRNSWMFEVNPFAHNWNQEQAHPTLPGQQAIAAIVKPAL